jgi:hypothetical protein
MHPSSLLFYSTTTISSCNELEMEVNAEEIAVVISLIYFLFTKKKRNTRFSLEQLTGNSF